MLPRGPGLSGYLAWKFSTNSDALPSSVASNQDVSSSVPSYPAQRTRYNSLQDLRQRSTLELRISETSYSGSPSTSTGGGGG